MHAVIRSHEYVLSPSQIYATDAQGYTIAALVDDRHGSVHTGLTLNLLSPAGAIREHVHSFEEGFYVLEGQAEVTIGQRVVKYGAGDFGVVKVGTLHSWRNVGDAPVRWLQMSAPQPKAVGRERDTFFARNAAGTTLGRSDSTTQGTPLWGHFDAKQVPPRADRPAGLGEGVFLKWLIDESFGAVHHRMVFINYDPGASIALHDHTFEEAYFILDGEIQATLDGQIYRVEAGDVVWTGVGCVHAFANVGQRPVRWLETFSPQPPRENVFRFMAEWDRRASELESEAAAQGTIVT